MSLRDLVLEHVRTNPSLIVAGLRAVFDQEDVRGLDRAPGTLEERPFGTVEWHAYGSRLPGLRLNFYDLTQMRYERLDNLVRAAVREYGNIILSDGPLILALTNQRRPIYSGDETDEGWGLHYRYVEWMPG